jgi:hypothetical protein
MLADLKMYMILKISNDIITRLSCYHVRIMAADHDGPVRACRALPGSAHFSDKSVSFLVQSDIHDQLYVMSDLPFGVLCSICIPCCDMHIELLLLELMLP